VQLINSEPMKRMRPALRQTPRETVKTEPLGCGGGPSMV
jgi:hypothetical protein